MLGAYAICYLVKSISNSINFKRPSSEGTQECELHTYPNTTLREFIDFYKVMTSLQNMLTYLS